MANHLVLFQRTTQFQIQSNDSGFNTLLTSHRLDHLRLINPAADCHSFNPQLHQNYYSTGRVG